MIKVGSYLDVVSDDLFVTFGYVVPVGGQQQGEERQPYILTLDYQLLRWLAAQVEASGQRGYGGGLGAETAW